MMSVGYLSQSGEELATLGGGKEHACMHQFSFDRVMVGTGNLRLAVISQVVLWGLVHRCCLSMFARGGRRKKNVALIR